MHEDIQRAHIEELTRQRDALKRKVDLLLPIVGSIPSIITSARLDQQQGKQTKLDYDALSRATNAPEY